MTLANDYRTRRAGERQQPYEREAQTNARSTSQEETLLERINTTAEFETALFIVVSYIGCFLLLLPLRISPPSLPRRIVSRFQEQASAGQPQLNQESIDRAKYVCPAKARSPKQQQPRARAHRQPACTSESQRVKSPTASQPGRQADQAPRSQTPPHQILPLLLLLLVCMQIYTPSQCSADAAEAKRNDGEGAAAVTSRSQLASEKRNEEQRRASGPPNPRTHESKVGEETRKGKREKREKNSGESARFDKTPPKRGGFLGRRTREQGRAGTAPRPLGRRLFPPSSHLFLCLAP